MSVDMTTVVSLMTILVLLTAQYRRVTGTDTVDVAITVTIPETKMTHPAADGMISPAMARLGVEVDFGSPTAALE